MIADSAADFLLTLVEPTRLRIVNCLAAAPLFRTDIASILALSPETVSRHLHVLRDLGVVHDVALPPYVLYQLDPLGPHGRLLHIVLETMRQAPPYGQERQRARAISRSDLAVRLHGAPTTDVHGP